MMNLLYMTTALNIHGLVITRDTTILVCQKK